MLIVIMISRRPMMMMMMMMIIIIIIISGDRNVIKKEPEKILKYKDLTTEIQRMWNVKSKGDISNNRGDWDYFKVI